MNVGAEKVEETDSNAVATSKKAEQKLRVSFVATLSRYGGSCTVHLNTCHVAARLLQNDVRTTVTATTTKRRMRILSRALSLSLSLWRARARANVHAR